MKKKIILITSILVILIVITLVILNNKKTNLDVDKDNKLSLSKEVSNVVFTNIKYSYEKEHTVISYKIFNKNDKDIKLNDYIVNVYDKNNKLLGTLEPVCESIIESNNYIFISTSKKEEYKKAYKLEIELPNLEYINE